MSIAEIITSGGDERILYKENGRNKYFVDPAIHEGVFMRGSCTCSALNPESHAMLEGLIERYEPNQHAGLVEAQSNRLKKLINYKGKDKFEVFFAPSGSDLCYYPLMFARILNPEKDILNFVTCPEELGQGSIFAFRGLFFAEQNQFGESIEKETPVDPRLDVEFKSFPARDKEGLIFNHKSEMQEAIESVQTDRTIMGHLVIGSKSGIVDNVDIIPKVKRDMLWVVDICQFRVSKKLINDLLDQGCMVMITGSKFYQSPPFCGALLVPKSLTQKIDERVKEETVAPFAKVFSQYDIPVLAKNLRSSFRKFENLGLLSRWETAIFEMEQISKNSVHSVLKVIGLWHSCVTEALEAEERFELMPDTDRTNKTIISFRVKNGGDGSYLNHEELQHLYEYISEKEVDFLSGFNRIIIGQPVRYGDESFIRVALGSFNIRKLIRNEKDLENDVLLIKYIAETAQKLYPR